MPNQSQQAQAATSSHSKSDDHHAKRIEVLFLRFSVIYGYVWQKIYQNESLLNLAKKEWQETLRPFNNTIIRDALQHCREYCPYPPSLPQFIDLCRAIKKRQNFFTRAQEDVEVSSPEVAERHLKKIKEQMKQGTKA